MYHALKSIPLWSKHSGSNHFISQSSLLASKLHSSHPQVWKIKKNFCSSRSKTGLKKNPPTGISDFRELRRSENNFAFVDKTMLIHEFLSSNPGATDLVLRPRGFGKSLNTSMLEYYLSILYKDLYKELFEGTLIDKKTEIKKRHSNKYPVISIDFDNFSANLCDSSQALTKYFHQLLLKPLNEYAGIMNKSDKLGEADRMVLQKLMTGEKAQVLSGLGELSRLLHKVVGKECIILLDEYDNPIHKVSGNDKRLAVLLDQYSSFLISGLKGNGSLARGLVTGCTKVALGHIFGGLNNLIVNSLLTKDSFQKHYGFSETEMNEFLKQTTDFADSEVKKYYNGYKVPMTQNGTVALMDVYNPFSIVHFSKNGEIKPYWAKTVELKIIEKDPKTTAELFKLVDGEIVEKPIENSISLYQTENKLWSLFFHAGYLTLESYPRIRTNDGGNGVYKLKIPNIEIKTAFVKLLKRFDFIRREEFKAPLNKSFAENNLRLFQQTMNSMINGQSFHSEDTIYWALWFHMGDNWNIFSSTKRLDIIVVPKERYKIRIGYMIGVRFTKKLKAILSELQEAIEQLEGRKYEEYFQSNNSPGVEKLVYIGIVGCNSRIFTQSKEVDAKDLLLDI